MYHIRSNYMYIYYSGVFPLGELWSGWKLLMCGPLKTFEKLYVILGCTNTEKPVNISTTVAMSCSTDFDTGRVVLFES